MIISKKESIAASRPASPSGPDGLDLSMSCSSSPFSRSVPTSCIASVAPVTLHSKIAESSHFRTKNVGNNIVKVTKKALLYDAHLDVFAFVKSSPLPCSAVGLGLVVRCNGGGVGSAPGDPCIVEPRTLWSSPSASLAGVGGRCSRRSRTRLARTIDPRRGPLELRASAGLSRGW